MTATTDYIYLQVFVHIDCGLTIDVNLLHNRARLDSLKWMGRLPVHPTCNHSRIMNNVYVRCTCTWWQLALFHQLSFDRKHMLAWDRLVRNQASHNAKTPHFLHVYIIYKWAVSKYCRRWLTWSRGVTDCNLQHVNLINITSQCYRLPVDVGWNRPSDGYRRCD